MRQGTVAFQNRAKQPQRWGALVSERAAVLHAFVQDECASTAATVSEHLKSRLQELPVPTPATEGIPTIEQALLIGDARDGPACCVYGCEETLLPAMTADK